MSRIIDGLSNNRVTDFEKEGASPMLRRTFGGSNSSFLKTFKHKSGRNLDKKYGTMANRSNTSIIKDLKTTKGKYNSIYLFQNPKTR